MQLRFTLQLVRLQGSVAAAGGRTQAPVSRIGALISWQTCILNTLASWIIGDFLRQVFVLVKLKLSFNKNFKRERVAFTTQCQVHL